MADTDIILSSVVIAGMGVISIGCLYYIFCRRTDGGMKQSPSSENLRINEDPEHVYEN